MAGLLKDAEQTKLGLDSYYAAGATRTLANSTLFVTGFGTVEKLKRYEVVESIFSAQPGYRGTRQVRSIMFVDFDSIKAATSALVKHQGRKLYTGHDGLTIDYDKDVGVASKRKAEGERSTEKLAHEANSADYFCAACGTKSLRTSGSLLSAMPCRSTDGATVVDESKQLGALLLTAAEQPVLVRRTKGVEKQWRLQCRSCSTSVAYRSAPTTSAGSFLYIHLDKLDLLPGGGANKAAKSSGDV